MTLEESKIEIQDIIDIYEKEDMYPLLNDRQISALKVAISALQALDKDTNVPCKDTISRQAAINAVGYYSVLSGDKLLFADNALKELPYAQPEHEKGKWTKDCACEICGFKPWYERDIHTLSFCPNCGADMREDQTDDNRPS